MKGRFNGSKLNEKCRLLLVPAGGAAEAAGLRVGDKVVAINGVSCVDIKHHKAAALLRTPGRYCLLRIRRKIPRRRLSVGSRTSRRGSHYEPDAYASTPHLNHLYSTIPDPPVHWVPVYGIPPEPHYADSYHESHLPALPYYANPVSRSRSYHSLYALPFRPEYAELAPRNSLAGSYASRRSRYGSMDSGFFYSGRDPVRVERFLVRMARDRNGLGFIISSRETGPGLPMGIYVSGIMEGSAAERNGQLSVGDRIVSINGVMLDECRHEQVVALLTCRDPVVSMVIERDRLAPADLYTAPEELIDGRRYQHPAGRDSLHSARPASPTPSILRNKSREYDRPRSRPPSWAESSPPRSRAHSPSGRRESSASGREQQQVRQVQQVQRPPPPLPASVKEFEFPPPPTDLGETTESITKQTVTERVVTRVTNNKLGRLPLITEDVIIRKDDGKLGLRIVGGADAPCTPFGSDPFGVYISQVVPNGAAGRTKRLRIGDRILKINGIDMSKATHTEAVAALSDADSELILTIRHEPPPKGLAELVVRRRWNERFGMKIKGGVYQHYAHDPEEQRRKCGIFISSIDADGAIARDGRLKVGMRLLEANRINLVGVSRKEALEALMKSSDMLHVIVCDAFNDDDDRPVRQRASASVSSERIRPDLLQEDGEGGDVAGAPKGDVQTTTIVMSKRVVQPQFSEEADQ